jgi:hypothetical protein
VLAAMRQSHNHPDERTGERTPQAAKAALLEFTVRSPQHLEGVAR